MKKLFLVKALVSDLEHFYIQADSKEKAKEIALNKINGSKDSFDEDNINDSTEYNHSFSIISINKVN